MSHHAMLGNIFNPKDGTEMSEEILEQERTAVQIDNDGNITIIYPV